MLSPNVRSTPPCLGPLVNGVPSAEIPEVKTTSWVEPLNVCEIRFREWTPDGLLRHAVFLRNRPDKPPRDCVRTQQLPAASEEQLPAASEGQLPAASDQLPAPATSELAAGSGQPAAEVPAAGSGQPAAEVPAAGSRQLAAEVQKTVTFSNLKKLYWPAEKYTKGDMIEYYRAISPWLLPYLTNRPLVLTRFPDGIDGKSFYQKDAPEFVPDWIRVEKIWSEETQREIRYFVADDVESILYVANMGSIPLHIWASRVDSLELPDWCVIDLDPKEAPFSDVITTAQSLHRLCDQIQLPHYVKTTGKTGLHIMIPLGRKCTYAQSRQVGELLGRVVMRELPNITTITRHVTKRGDKVYLDYLQNRHGQTIVAPFSVRPLPGATVSMPLTWDEVVPGLDPKTFTIRNAAERMEKLGTDPVLPVLTEIPDLAAILQRLATHL